MNDLFNYYYYYNNSKPGLLGLHTGFQFTCCFKIQGAGGGVLYPVQGKRVKHHTWSARSHPSFLQSINITS